MVYTDTLGSGIASIVNLSSYSVEENLACLRAFGDDTRRISIEGEQDARVYSVPVRFVGIPDYALDDLVEYGIATKTESRLWRMFRRALSSFVL